jgi:transketolase
VLEQVNAKFETDNLTDISIDGDTAVAFTENVEQRFLSYGWQVLHVDDGDTLVRHNNIR